MNSVDFTRRNGTVQTAEQTFHIVLRKPRIAVSLVVGDEVTLAALASLDRVDEPEVPSFGNKRMGSLHRSLGLGFRPKKTASIKEGDYLNP